MLHKFVECISGLRKGRVGQVITLTNNFHVKVKYQNGAEHWEQIRNVRVLPQGNES